MVITFDERRPYREIPTAIGISLAIASVVLMLLVGAVSGHGSTPLPNLIKEDDGLCNCYNPGDIITYKICYDNTATDSVNIWCLTLTDMLPSETTFINASDGGTYNKNTHTVTWEIASLPKGTAACVTVNVSIKPGTTKVITNTATLAHNYKFFANIDTSKETEICATEIPEFSTITLPVASILSLFLFFRIARKQRTK
jgi:uncharacterized repeat protein (TIGR01451 family)